MPPFVRTLFEAVLGLFVVAVAWEVAALLIDNPTRLPLLTVVLRKALALAPSDDYLRHVTDSATALLLGLPPALAAGVLVGALAGRSPGMRLLIGPIAVALAAAPLIALLPVFVAWWGLTMTTKVVTIFVVALFPTLNAVMAAIAARHHRARLVAQRTLLAQPSGAASPACAIVASLRLGVVLGVTALIVSEFVASSRGVGYFIMSSANMLDTTAMMAGIVLVVVPTVLVAAFLQAIEEQLAQ